MSNVRHPHNPQCPRPSPQGMARPRSLARWLWNGGSRHTAVSGVLAVALVWAGASTASAQHLDHHWHYPWHHPWHYHADWHAHHAIDALSAQMHARAHLERAYAEAAVNYAMARDIRAHAVDQEISNWKKFHRTRWTLRAERQQAIAVKRYNENNLKWLRIEDHKARRARQLESVMYYSDRERGAIESGEALNYLLDRLWVMSRITRLDRAEDLTLSPELLPHLTLKAGVIRFPAGSLMEHREPHWLPPLDEPGFASLREAYVEAQARLQDESEQTGRVSLQAIDEAKTPLLDMLEELERSDWVNAWMDKDPFVRHGQRARARRMLVLLDRQLDEMRERRSANALGFGQAYDLATMGNHIVDFVSYMNRHGLKFAKCRPGDEAAYYTVFELLTELYQQVRDRDPIIRPRKLHEEMVSFRPSDQRP